MKDQGSIKPPLSLLCSTFTLTCASELKLEQNLTEPSICPSFPKLETRIVYFVLIWKPLLRLKSKILVPSRLSPIVKRNHVLLYTYSQYIEFPPSLKLNLGIKVLVCLISFRGSFFSARLVFLPPSEKLFSFKTGDLQPCRPRNQESESWRWRPLCSPRQCHAEELIFWSQGILS